MKAQQIFLVCVVGVFIAIGRSFATSKTTECNNMAKVANQAAANGKELTKALESKDYDQITTGLNTAISQLSKSSQDMKAIKINDTKLKGYQMRFTTLYQEATTALSTILSTAQAKDMTKLYQTAEEGKLIEEREKTLTQEINNYCSSK
jgi:hypothetical protein